MIWDHAGSIQWGKLSSTCRTSIVPILFCYSPTMETSPFIHAPAYHPTPGYSQMYSSLLCTCSFSSMTHRACNFARSPSSFSPPSKLASRELRGDLGGSQWWVSPSFKSSEQLCYLEEHCRFSNNIFLQKLQVTLFKTTTCFTSNKRISLQWLVQYWAQPWCSAQS